MKKRITSGILAVLLVFGAMAPTMTMTSFAAESSITTQASADNAKEPVYTYGDFKYTKQGDCCTIVEYVGKGGTVTIPYDIQGYKVTEIASGLLRDNLTVQTIYIETTAAIPSFFASGCTNLKKLCWQGRGRYQPVYINSYAFNLCTSLSTIEFPTSGIAKLGGWAFRETSCTSLTIPVTEELWEKGCPSIYSAFVGSDTKQVIFTGYTKVPANICMDMSKLCDVQFADNTTDIGDHAFFGCVDLERIELPSRLQYLGASAFRSTLKLHTIAIPGTVTSFGDQKWSPAFENSGIESAELGDGLQEIPSYAFKGADKLKSVSIPDNVTKVNTMAFSNNLIEELRFSSKTKTFNTEAFSNLKNLKKVYIPCYDATFGKDFCVDCPNVVFYVVSNSTTERKLKTMGYKTANILNENTQYTNLANKATASISNMTYTGHAITPTSMKVYDGSGKLLTYGTDYTVSAKNNINVGTATVTITGKGKYHGSFTSSFKITPKALTLKVSGDGKTRYYNGTAQKPVLTVKDANNSSRKLVQGQDYSVSFSTKCINACTVKATVTLKGNYTGSATYSFKINPRNIGNVSVTGINSKGYSYTGYAIKPNITLSYKVGSKKITLKKGTDYTVSYKGNTNNGTATMTITGKGNYSGSVKKTFKINKRSMNNCTVDASKVYYTKQSSVYNNLVKVYTNNSKKKQLTLNKDYTIKWDCKGAPAVGKHTVTLTAKNKNLKGSYKLTVIVRPQGVGSNVSLKTNGKKALKATWKGPSAGTCSGFRTKLMMQTSRGWKCVKTTDIRYKKGVSTFSNSWSKLSKGTYKLEVSAYTTVGKTKYFSAPRTTSKVTVK